jgi:hypothetical protein
MRDTDQERPHHNHDRLTSLTLDEAIAELRRIGPVYSAATRLVDNPANHVARTDELHAAVAVARAHQPAPHKLGDVMLASSVHLDERAAEEWQRIEGRAPPRSKG